MISLVALRAAMTGDRVVFDPDGAVLDVQAPDDDSEATLLVAAVTDAAKRVEGDRVVESLDRSELLMLEGIVLSRGVLDRLGGGVLELDELLEAVVAAGHEWRVSLTDAP